MIILVLGGASSGKSEIGERLAGGLGAPVTFVATGARVDQGMTDRIAAHRALRPPSWATEEVRQGGNLALVLRDLSGVALVDSLGTWVAGMGYWAKGAGDLHGGEAVVITAIGRGLCDILVSRDGDTVVVSDEVGLGVHPATDTGRRFRDALGRLNAQVAEVADRVLLVVAGQVLLLDRPSGVAGVAGLGGLGDELGWSR